MALDGREGDLSTVRLGSAGRPGGVIGTLREENAMVKEGALVLIAL
jgi:hypothetical protein